MIEDVLIPLASTFLVGGAVWYKLGRIEERLLLLEMHVYKGLRVKR